MVEIGDPNQKVSSMKGAAKIIIKWSLGIQGELIAEFYLKLKVMFVSSEKNKADALN